MVWTSSFRKELSSMKSLIHFTQFSYSFPLFAVSVGGQAFKGQYVLDSSFLFSDEHILCSLFCLNYRTRMCSLWHPGKSGCFSSSSLEVLQLYPDDMQNKIWPKSEVDCGRCGARFSDGKVIYTLPRNYFLFDLVSPCCVLRIFYLWSIRLTSV